MIRKIVLNGREVQYELLFKDVKNINLRIRADQSIFVSANKTVSIKDIESFIQSRADYILNTLTKFSDIAKFSPKPKNYLNGESFSILGHELRLNVIEGSKNIVKTDESYIYLIVTNKLDIGLKKRILEKWLYAKCQQIIREMCEKWYPIFKKYGVTLPNIRFRNMISRWGSCQPKRKVLTFNYRLVEVPLSCIEYVVVHEFTHLLQPNHSKQFYYQLTMFMPDWENRKTILEKCENFSE